ncbi:hypothetical protein EXIGLDRAFT_705004 [Exidia glandulosa HHB12029]|uniref:F-box domain-containing protein n=1 Tax=Exidia glandulosa HHB12029 TaxID=1314781 RepID=A0A165BGE3_EXIGL|nr:hypothetical protein EXIGLDRAFT_705004 [Exidia glandulosa HHB12029]
MSINDLPPEILTKAISHLLPDTTSVARCGRVSRRFRVCASVVPLCEPECWGPAVDDDGSQSYATSRGLRCKHTGGYINLTLLCEPDGTRRVLDVYHLNLVTVALSRVSHLSLKFTLQYLENVCQALESAAAELLSLNLILMLVDGEAMPPAHEMLFAGTCPPKLSTVVLFNIAPPTSGVFSNVTRLEYRQQSPLPHPALDVAGLENLTHLRVPGWMYIKLALDKSLQVEVREACATDAWVAQAHDLVAVAVESLLAIASRKPYKLSEAGVRAYGMERYQLSVTADHDQGAGWVRVAFEVGSGTASRAFYIPTERAREVAFWGDVLAQSTTRAQCRVSPACLSVDADMMNGVLLAMRLDEVHTLRVTSIATVPSPSDDGAQQMCLPDIDEGFEGTKVKCFYFVTPKENEVGKGELCEFIARVCGSRDSEVVTVLSRWEKFFGPSSRRGTDYPPHGPRRIINRDGSVEDPIKLVGGKMTYWSVTSPQAWFATKLLGFKFTGQDLAEYTVDSRTSNVDSQ